MSRDELKQPLRQRSLGQRLWQRRPNALLSAYVLVAVSLIISGVWVAKKSRPFAGEPVITVAVAVPEEIKTASVQPSIEADPPLEKPVTKPAPSTPEQDATVYVNNNRPLAKAPSSLVTESSALGPLPRIGAGNKKPSEVYARPVSLGVIHSDSSKIVIILGGMGLNEKLTSRAAKDLSSDITFAFAPYGENLQEQVDKARGLGHEVLLQLPLEPVGFPATNPGPKTLLADAAPAANLDSLLWHMSRFAGYVGIINYMGGRFLASDAAVKPLLTELRKRGVLFMEDGSLPVSATDGVAKAMQFPVRHAHSVIDLDPTPAAITQALTALEDEAHNNGIAIGTGSGLEVTIDTLRDWARSAADRGIIIVPATAAFRGRLG